MFCFVTEGMPERGRLASAKSKLQRAGTSLTRALAHSLSVDFDSSESPRKKRKTKDERLITR